MGLLCLCLWGRRPSLIQHWVPRAWAVTATQKVVYNHWMKKCEDTETKLLRRCRVFLHIYLSNLTIHNVVWKHGVLEGDMNSDFSYHARINFAAKKKNSCSIFLLDIPSDGKQRELFINPNFLEAFCLLHHPGPSDSKRWNSYNDSNHHLPTAVFITAAHVYCACTCQALLSILNSLTPHFILTSTLWNGWLLSSYYR